MSHQRRLGIGLTIGGMVIATLGSVWLALRPTTLIEDPSLFLVAVGVFAVVFALMISGGYLFLKASTTQPEASPAMELPLQLLDYLRQHGEISVADMADALQVPLEAVHHSLDELLSLQLFTGYVRADGHHLCAVPRPVLEAMQACLVCATPLSMGQKGHTACPQCGTSYYLPKI